MNLEVELIAGVIKGGLPPENLPAPRLIKIFIAGERNEFEEERKQLLELAGPELQSIYEDKDIEVLLVDMQYATTANPDRNPFLAEHFLDEIRAAYQHSRGCFLLLLLGDEYSSGWLPTKFSVESYEILSNQCPVMEEHYERDSDCYFLKASSMETASHDWQEEEPGIRKALKKAAESIVFEKRDNEEIRNILKSTAERQLEYGLKLDKSGEGIIAVTRKWKDKKSPRAATLLKSLVESNLPSDNIINVEVEQKAGGIDPNNRAHKRYLAHLCRLVVNRVQNLVDASIEVDPEIKSKKKMVQEIYAESLMHIALIRDVKPCEDHENVERIKELLISGKSQKHEPIFIKGGKYSGKSSLLSRIYTDASSWLDCTTFKVVRLCASTPQSSYSLELLRLLCQHIGFLSGSLDGNFPKDVSFDFLYLNNWLAQIMRRIEEEPLKEQLLILLDDLHRLYRLDCGIVAALSWIPLNLPPGVHLVITTAIPPELLRLTRFQKERFRSTEILIELQDSPPDFQETENVFDTSNKLIGECSANRIGAILASTEYGLSETEVLIMIMPTGNDEPLSLEKGLFNFSTWCLFRRTFDEFLKVRVLNGKLLFSWQYPIRDLARKRYFPNQEILKSCHGELANLFFPEDFENKDDETSPKEETSFQSRPRSWDTAYNIRHVEEAWLHLLRAGDMERLKKLAVCAFDFLLTAVQMISVSYLKCVLEHSRSYLLERDLELVYYTVGKSSDILARDPLQLPAQLIYWLKPMAEDGDDLVSRIVTAAMAWSDSSTVPLLMPLNSWFQSPLPLQIRTLFCPEGVKLVEVAPSGQHLIVVPFQGDAQLWHLMSNHLVHTFKGHSNPISCLTVTQHSQYLLTGSEDTSIIVWDMKELSLKLRIQEHIAPVLSLTTALKNSVIVSGGEDSRIIITSLLTGEVLIKIDHHRGPVNSIRIDSAGEILVSGSSDCTVCLWCLQTFTLLNSIILPSAITMLDVSTDSVFLLAACEDQKLYLRSLATGTEIHTLGDHQGEIKSICLARDCRRAIAGGIMGKVSIFDMHSGRLITTLPVSFSANVTTVKVTEKDDFLITAAGDRVTYWTFRGEEDPWKRPKPDKRKYAIPHTAPISCMDVSPDGLLAVTGGVDALVNLWQLSTHKLYFTCKAHTANVTCASFSASGLCFVTGSEDKVLYVWKFVWGMVTKRLKLMHEAPIVTAALFEDQKLVSSIRGGTILVWNIHVLKLEKRISAAGRCITISSNMRYAVCKTENNQVQIINLGLKREERYQVTHSQDITCLAVTPDCMSLITGSMDMSLKVWHLSGGKLSQVLVGHTNEVTCVAVSAFYEIIIVSGSRDTNLIIWNLYTGDVLYTLKGHLSWVTCVKLTYDGSLAASAGEDKSLFIWDIKKGCSLISIMLHVPVLGLGALTDFSRLALHLLKQKDMSILCLHNTPARYVDLRRHVHKRVAMPNKLLLRKEISLDTDTWRKKYADHFTTGKPAFSIENLKQFGVITTRDEIHEFRIASTKLALELEKQIEFQQSLGLEELKLLSNKQSPPAKPRLHGKTLFKQNSLQATRISDSEEEGLPD